MSPFSGRRKPYGTSVTVAQDGKMVEDVEPAVKHQAKRTVEVAKWLKKGRETVSIQSENGLSLPKAHFVLHFSLRVFIQADLPGGPLPLRKGKHRL